MELTFNFDSARFAFGQHDRVTIEGTPYKVVLVTEDGVVFQVVGDHGLCQQFTHGQLSRLASMGRIRQERDYFLASTAGTRLRGNAAIIADLVGKKAAVHAKRSAFVEAFLQLEREGKIKRSDKVIREKSGLLMYGAMQVVRNVNPSGLDDPGLTQDMRRPPSPRSLRTWLKNYERMGMVGLIDAMHRRGHRGRRMGPEELGLLQREVNGYLNPDRPTVKQIHENVLIAFAKRTKERAEAGLPPFVPPSRETVRRAIRELDPFAVVAAREGIDMARKKFRPVSNGLGLTRPLERVEIDETPLDVISYFRSCGLVDLMTEEEQAEVGLDRAKGRWKLTIAICATTRCIVGLVLSRTATTDAALQTLQMILTNKGRWEGSVASHSQWDLYGTPEGIVTDCASPYRSEVFRSACADLGIVLQHAIAGVPEARGRGERIFSTASKGVAARLSGHTYSDIVTKGDADPEARAALNLEDLSFVLVRWVVDVYHNTSHAGLGGETPLECWRRLAKEYGVTAPPDIERQRAIFGRRVIRSLNKEGVTIMGVRYHSQVLAKWMLRRDPCKVEARWHPKDIGAVQVLLGRDWHTVPSVVDGLDGVAAQLWLQANREVHIRKPDATKRNLTTVLAAVQAIRERNSAAMQAADLLVEKWDDQRIEREERRLFAQVQFVTPKVRQSDDGGVGISVEAANVDPAGPDEVPEPTAAAKTKAKRAKKDKRATTTKPTIEPTRADADDGFSIEEN